MSLSLNQINASAYAKAAAALEQNGKAAVKHATGTGKSCIAWQLIADHPQASFIWLVYGAARLTLRREDVRRYNDGVLPENLIFCDCGVLAEASAEEWVQLASRKPDYLIFDCYHEVTAACWAKSAQRLLRLCPEAKLLGLTVPNSTDQKCQAAAELFEGTVVSRMTVGEGMALGTLPQAFEPGMGIFGMGVSHWQGEQAVALGFSKASDNGRVILRASSTYNTRRQAGGAVSVGFQF